jgi:hypothetical protein
VGHDADSDKAGAALTCVTTQPGTNRRKRKEKGPSLITYRAPCCPQNYGVEEGLLKMTSLEMFVDENLINYRFRNIFRLPLPLASVSSSSPSNIPKGEPIRFGGVAVGDGSSSAPSSTPIEGFAVGYRPCF